MKQRFSSLDVKVIAHELSESLCGLRLSNIYDLSSQIFLLKFAKPSVRKQIVLDTGFRCHLTNFTRTTANEPTPFVARLRKFLRTRRVTAVSQIGTDRVLEFQFSDGRYRLFLEFYASGNVVLTDQDLKVLSLWRIVEASGAQEELRVGLKYALESRQNFGGIPPLTEERVRDALRKASEQAGSGGTTNKKFKKKPRDAVRSALAVALNEFPPILIEHALTLKNFDFGKSVEDVLSDDDVFRILMDSLHMAQELIVSIMSKEVCTGYIIAKSSGKPNPTNVSAFDEDEGNKENDAFLFEDFHPFLPKQEESRLGITVLEIEGFNATVDRFFSSIESQRLEAALQEQHEKATRKLKATADDHAARVEGLQQVQHLNVRKAQSIEGNIHWVNEACAAVNGLIAQGMDWVEIDKLIEMEQARNNSVAQLIKLPLKLHENTVTLLLAEETFSDEDDEDEMSDRTDSEDSDHETSTPQRKSQAGPPKEDKRLHVDIDLALTPWANARLYYEQKKSAAVKEGKTKLSSVKALKSAEKKVKADLQKDLKKEKNVLRPVRKQLWFEKYFYFVSSEGYLVVGGRDKPQAEILYSRYFQSGDVWIHCDVNGATPVIVKNKASMRASEIPLLTLSQAGNFCVISSSAWDTKAMMGSWWVDCKQVTKLDSTGQYLGPGDFIIKGEKNNLPPAQLLLGFGVMFRISSENKAQHMRHRLREGEDDTAEKLPSAEQDLTRGEPEESLGQGSAPQEDPDDVSDQATAISDDEPELSDTDAGDEAATAYVNPLQSHETGESNSAVGPQMNELKIHEDDDVVAERAEEDSSDDGDHSEQATADAASELPGKQTASTISEAPAAVSKAAPQVRGKRGKRAKIKSKYADQDEEDRELTMKLLGSRPNPEKSQAAAEPKVDREAVAAQQKERRQQQHKLTQESGKATEEARQKMIASGEGLMSPEELAELDLVDNFVGIPQADDELLDCLVVCGPWDTMGSRLRWKMKLQPGSVKKGKAVKELLSNWHKFIAEKEKKTPNPEKDDFGAEKQLRKQGEMVMALRDVEIIGLIPVGKVRLITAGGGDKAKGVKQSGKSGKGGGKKKR